MAYTVVEPTLRGCGYGRDLFDQRLAKIAEVPDNVILFDLARGIYAQRSGLAKTVTTFLLDHEKQVNGLKEDGSVNVQGAWTSINQLSDVTSVDLSMLSPESGAHATVHQCKGAGFHFIGFSRNFSPVWCREK